MKYIIEDVGNFRREIKDEIMEIIKTYAHEMPIRQFFEIERCVDELIALRLGIKI